MFESKKKRKKTAKERLGKSDGEVKLSAKGDEDARKYLADMPTPLPVRFKYKDSKKEDETNNPEKMKTVKSAFSSEDDRFVKFGEFEFYAAGWMEMGYDKKTKELITSFKAGYRSRVERDAYENRPYYLRTLNSAKLRSSDKSFKEGATFLGTPEDRIYYRRIIERLENFSDKREHNTTYDSAEPFHQTKEEENKLEQLKNMRRQSGFKDSGLDKAITGVTTYKNRKDTMNVRYERKFKQTIEDVKSKIKSNLKNDDIWLYLLKKKQMEQQQLLLGEDIVKTEMLQQILIELLKLRIKQLSKDLNLGN